MGENDGVGGVFLCSGCWNKVPQASGLNNRTLFLSALQARSPRSEAAGLVSSKASLRGV